MRPIYIRICSISLGSTYTKSSIYKLESIQRQTAQFVMGDFQRTSSVTSMISSLNWTTLETHIKILRLVLFFKILNNHADLLLPDYIMNSARDTRGNDRKFILPSMNIDAYKFSFHPNVIGLWNNLPPEIANSLTSDDFKNSLLLYFS